MRIANPAKPMATMRIAIASSVPLLAARAEGRKCNPASDSTLVLIYPFPTHVSAMWMMIIRNASCETALKRRAKERVIQSLGASSGSLSTHWPAALAATVILVCL